MTLPFKGPDATLLQLMGVVVSAGQRFAAISDMQVGRYEPTSCGLVNKLLLFLKEDQELCQLFTKDYMLV